MLIIPKIEWDLVAEKIVPDEESEDLHSVLITHGLGGEGQYIGFCGF